MDEDNPMECCADCPDYDPGHYLGPGISPIPVCHNAHRPMPVEMDTEFPDWCPRMTGAVG